MLSVDSRSDSIHIRSVRLYGDTDGLRVRQRFEAALAVLSGKDIVWVVGHRIDERYKVSDFTKKIFFAELHK